MLFVRVGSKSSIGTHVTSSQRGVATREEVKRGEKGVQARVWGWGEGGLHVLYLTDGPQAWNAK